MEITGILHFVGETQQVSDKFKKRDFVIKETSSQYPQLIQFQVTQDKCDIVDRPIGSELTVHFNLRGREWVSPTGEKKYFNTLEAWRVVGSTNSIAGMKKEDVAHQENKFNAAEGDDLPF